MWRVPREWEGEAAFLLGGGPSLKAPDAERLRGRRVIAINRSLELAPWADVHLFADRKYYDNYRQTFGLFTGKYRVAGARVPRQSGAVYLTWHRDGPALSKDAGAAAGADSGAMALNVAYLFGAGPIYLLGYDYRTDENGVTHWHGGYGWRCRTDLWKRKHMPALERMWAALQGEGIEVFNCNPKSAIRCFPFKSLDEALGE